ncbi:MAG: glycosyltransferase family 39 protein [Endomicrobiaceae bacterium]|nr:glycosyltransferase family 39 protein [Endomicrobiaceae bacterium]
MPSNKIHINNSLIIFTVIAVWYAITNFLWWHINTPILPYYDSSAVHFLDIFKNQILSAPLVAFIARFMFSIFGKEYFDLIIIGINYIFFLIPLYFIYKIGKEIDSKETGNIAMILFALVPAIYGLSRQYGHKDYHIIAAVALNIYCLIKTNSFQDKKWSAIYGISIGLGLLIKEQFFAYFLMPFIWEAINALRTKPKKSTLLNIVISVIIGFIVAAVHYCNPDAIKKVFTDPMVQSKPIFAFESIRTMTFALYDELLSLPIFLVCLAGLWYFIKQHKNKHKVIVLLWIFVPWTIIFLMPHYKVSEYCSGFIPAMILIGSIFISHIKRNDVKKMLLIFLITIGIIQYINFSYFPGVGLSKIYIKFHSRVFKYYNTNSKNIMNFDANKKSENIVRVVDFIDKLCPKSKLSVYIDEKASINNRVLRSCMLLKDMKCLPRDRERFVLRYDQDAIVIVGEMPLVINKNKKIINKDFYMAATTFYMRDRKGEYNKIRIFKRKNIAKAGKKNELQ